MTLYLEPYIVPAADLGVENPLPVFRAHVQDNEINFEANNVPHEDREGMGWQTGFRVLPYRMQDGYNRAKHPREFTSVVLENRFLKVRVLPEVGGLVASIIYKPLGRELLYCNPVFQPGNLALRNAWVSGGIEWNTPQLGHHYLTCSPVHTARLTSDAGDAVLRMYAWERVKCFPYQIELHLPEDSPFLFAHVRLINPHDHVLPMYWWTNIAVPEYPGGRVICPADTAYKHHTVAGCPVIDGVDYSYATRLQSAYDLYFRIHEDQRKWVAIIDRNGTGLIHTSTGRLKGRKMFAWGMGQGGRRWNEYLSVPEKTFQEIQAGLAPTQYHSVPMPPKTEWEWTEAVGYLESDPQKTHSMDWHGAYREVDRILEAMLPEQSVEQFHDKAAAMARQLPDENLFRGLGWGALETRRAVATNQSSAIPPELPFSDIDLTGEQDIWLHLLDKGFLPERDPQDDPGHYMIDDSWRMLIEEGLRAGRGDHWLTWYHLGVIRLESGDQAGAAEAWNRSINLRENGWSWRCLAHLKNLNGDPGNARECWLKAWQTGPKIPALAVEYASSLLASEDYNALDEFISDLPQDVACHERIRMVKAKTALHFGQFEVVEDVLEGEFATIKEGEISLTDIWFELHEKKLSAAEGIPIDDELKKRVRRDYPPPARIDFRMSVPDDGDYIPPQAIGAQE